MFNRWFVDHQTRVVAIGDNVITPMRKESSAKELRLGGLLYRVRQPDGLIIHATRTQQAMSIVDCLFAETERFHQGDGSGPGTSARRCPTSSRTPRANW